MKLRKAGNTIVLVSRKGNPTPHPDRMKGLAFGKTKNKNTRAYRNAICENCGTQDKYVRDNKCLSKMYCIYRQRNWKESGNPRPWWSTRDTMTFDHYLKLLSKMTKIYHIKWTPEEMEREAQFYKERFEPDENSSLP